MKLNIIKLLLGIILISFTGIEWAHDTEDYNIFIKDKPNFKFVFHSSFHELDETLSHKEKEKYQEYLDVVFSHTHNKIQILDRVSIFIIVLATVLMISGLVGLIVNKKTKEIKLLLLDYFMQFALIIFLIGLYAIRPYHENLPTDGRFYVLIYFLLALTFDYLIRRELTKNMQKQQIQNDAKAK
jgi:hypothetical protein